MSSIFDDSIGTKSLEKKKTLVVSAPAREDELTVASHIIQSGGLVVFPTETVYGLGANAYDASAVMGIFKAKGRPSDNPLIVHVSKPEDAENFAYTTTLFYKLAKAFMPGPLTVILKKRSNIPASVTAGLDTVGVRCPSHETAHRLLSLCKVPVAAPSANLSGRPSPTKVTHVIEDMNGRVDAIIDGGECEYGLESTVVLPTGEDSLKILRPGAVTADALRCVCGDVTLADGADGSDIEKPLSPGMKYKHYAPRSPLILLDGKREDVVTFVASEMKQKSCLFICYDEDAAPFGDRALTLGRASDEASHAHRLFDCLRCADEIGETKRIDVIYTYMPAKGEDGLSPAIYNRLIRAAGHTVMKL